MEIAGYSVDLLTLVQVGTTALIVGIYAILTSLGEQRADHQSDCQMILLLSFVTQEHPTLKSLDSIVDHKTDAVDSGGLKIHEFSENFLKFRDDGTLPSLESSHTTTVGENLFAVMVSPLFAVVGIVLLREWHKIRLFRIRNTEIRKNYFSKMVLMAVGGIGYFLAGAALYDILRWLAFVLMGLGAVAVIASVVNIAILTYEQQSWKSYWGDKLLEILATQDHEEAHDQFNRAHLLSNSLDDQPDVPFPGRLGLYTGIYSLTQALILLVSSQLAGI